MEGAVGAGVSAAGRWLLFECLPCSGAQSRSWTALFAAEASELTSDRNNADKTIGFRVPLGRVPCTAVVQDKA